MTLLATSLSVMITSTVVVLPSSMPSDGFISEKIAVSSPSISRSSLTFVVNETVVFPAGISMVTLPSTKLTVPSVKSSAVTPVPLSTTSTV